MRTKKFIREYSEVLLALCSITLITFLIIGGFSRQDDYNATRTYSVNNNPEAVETWNLSYNDFDNKVYRLSGSHYYPNLLLTPEDIDNHESVPIEGAEPVEYLTQRFIIKVPQNGQAYNITMEGDFWSAKAYSNGLLIDSSGTPADNSDDLRVGRDPITIYASPDEDGYIDIIVQNAAFRHNRIKAEALVAYVSLVPTGLGYVYTPVDRSFDAVLVGVYIGLAMFTLALFFTHFNQTEHLWMAIICAFMAISSGVDGATFSEVIPIASEDFVYYMYFLGQPIIMLFFVMYFNAVFANVLSDKILMVLGGLTIILLAIIAFTPPVVFTAIVSVYNILTPIIYLMFLIPFVVKMRNFWPEHIISLFGMAALGLSGVYDFFNPDTYSNSSSYSASDIAILLLIVTQLIYLYMTNRRRAIEAVEHSRIAALENESLEKIDLLKTEFLANISHELKTPLAVISGYAQTAARSLESNGDIAENAKKMRLINSESERLALMVSQLLDVTRIDEGRMVLKCRPTQLDPLIKTTLDAYVPALNKNSNRVLYNRAYDLPDANIDETRIRQVLVNLLSNAMKHTESGEIKISAELQDTVIQVSIADNGKGISKEQLAILFERFSKKEAGSGKDAGTGLGLYICRHIVEAHGGKISVTSELSVGTTISFTIPTASDD